jgi:hypothetical protein
LKLGADDRSRINDVEPLRMVDRARCNAAGSALRHLFPRLPA